jgi:hypothetical protein
VVSFVINNILLNQPDFKCGCLCKEYTTDDGNYTFAFEDVRCVCVARCALCCVREPHANTRRCDPPAARAVSRTHGAQARRAARTTAP